MNECLLLVPGILKKDIIKIVRERYYDYNIKFMTLEEFIKKYVFDYDNKTIYCVMDRYNVNYDTAVIYLNNLYYISDKISSNKMDKLREIKKYLDENGLLIYNDKFKSYVLDKQIYIYGYDYINKYYLSVLEGLNYNIIDRKYNKHDISRVYSFNHIEDEVLFVANKISKLLKNNITIDKIKLIISSEYKEVIKRIFMFYNIPINVSKSSVYSTYVCKRVLDNLNDIENVLDDIKDIDIKNKIIGVLNNYSFISDKERVKELIINDLKNCYLDNLNSGVEILSLDNYFDDDAFVFLMGFNKENYPKIYKDNDYFSDREKCVLGYDTSLIINDNERNSVVNKILNIKNLTISYKKYDNSGNYSKCDLFEDIITQEVIDRDYSASNMMNKVFLTNMLDNLVKYNVVCDDIGLLYSNYDIPYMKYDNSYKGIDKNKLYKFLDNKLTLSYTSFDNYNKCKFKYYLNNILHINVFKDDFAIIIGNICHYVLSNMDNDDVDVYKYFDDYVEKEREFTSREKFFIDGIRNEMEFIVNTIRKQFSYSSFDRRMYEKKVYVNKDRDIKITFMGVIDKVLYKEEDGITYLSVIDYKTGSTDIKLDNMEFGIGMQLPIYLYLSSNMKLDNVKVVGFYLQKLLSNNLDNSKDFYTARENTLKLEGYSIDNESILSKFDNTYNDSKLIKSMKTSSNGFYAYAKVLDEDKMEKLISDTDNLIDKAIDGITSLDFRIDPKVINGDNVSCKFCDYKDICYRREKDLKYINTNS